MIFCEIVVVCEQIYCGFYGVEFIYIFDREKCDWFCECFEVFQFFKYFIDEKCCIFDCFIWFFSFEVFLVIKYFNDKRFGLEGCEILVFGMKVLIDCSVDYGVKDIVIGMFYCGCFNVFFNVVCKFNEFIFSEFVGIVGGEDEGFGDVKYYLGMNFECFIFFGKCVQLFLVVNFFYLEVEDFVVFGKVCVIQYYNNDEVEYKSVMVVFFYGDVVVVGQGVVYECLGFYQFFVFLIGGIIYLVVNNQIGFIIDFCFFCLIVYCIDIVKVIDVFVFYVNVDDVEFVNFVCQFVVDWCVEFKQDVVIDFVCYCKYGYNEIDQLFFIQFLMYKCIQEKNFQIEIYVDQFLKEGIFIKEDVEEYKQWVWGMLEESFVKFKDYQFIFKEWIISVWNNFKFFKEFVIEVFFYNFIGVDCQILEYIGIVIGIVFEGFNVYCNLKCIFVNCIKLVVEGKNIDWFIVEVLVFGIFVMEGKYVCIFGQDVECGIFFQCYVVFYDQEIEDIFIFFQYVGKDQGKFVIFNFFLSEYGVFGFEYGYFFIDFNGFVMWEVQFGDFVNNVQVVFDQFIVFGEIKWMQCIGFVVFLFYGYDGQGFEYFFGCFECFFQFCNEDFCFYFLVEKFDCQYQDCNMQVVYMIIFVNLFYIFCCQMNW